MPIDTSYLAKCIKVLSKAKIMLNELESKEVEYDIYRAACVKEFEIIIEQSAKLLKQALIPYFHSIKAVKILSFKDVFRHAARFDLLTLEEVERWLIYRDNRNQTAHDYGEGFAEKTLTLLDSFIDDASRLEQKLTEQDYD